jgi:hypothetical protein
MATDLQNGHDTSVTGLVKGILEDLQDLTKQQFALFKQEVKEDMTKTRNAALPMVMGLVVALVGVLLLAHGLAWVLAALGLPTWAAFLIVGAVITGAGAVLFLIGQHQFATFNPLPDRSLEALKENVQCLTNPK